jgi:hypothetical protein
MKQSLLVLALACMPHGVNAETTTYTGTFYGSCNLVAGCSNLVALAGPVVVPNENTCYVYMHAIYKTEITVPVSVRPGGPFPGTLTGTGQGTFIIQDDCNGGLNTTVQIASLTCTLRPTATTSHDHHYVEVCHGTDRVTDVAVTMTRLFDFHEFTSRAGGFFNWVDNHGSLSATFPK